MSHANITRQNSQMVASPRYRKTRAAVETFPQMELKKNKLVFLERKINAPFTLDYTRLN